jgi:hypothetical protein
MMIRAALLVVFVVLGSILLGPAARAETEPPAHEASRHFQRGVDLYGEGDFRGALVEFKRAHSVLPRATVLYNIGQTEYQLHDYAAALRTLERFLAETGRNADHRTEVEETVEVLRGRVGRIVVASDRMDCDVTIDDHPAGATPVAQPIAVSVGSRRVAVACPGLPRGSREVEVAGGETIRVELNFGPTHPFDAPPSALSAAATPPAGPSKGAVTAAWVATGILGAATVAAYAGAFVEGRQLDDLRHTYPITANALDDKVKLTSRLALAGDILAVTTAASAGLAVYLGWSSHRERGLALGLSPGGVTVGGRF